MSEIFRYISISSKKLSGGHCLVVLSVQDTAGRLSAALLEKLHKIGFSKLTNEHRRAYIGVVNKGESLFDASAEKINTQMEYSADVSGLNLYVTSNPPRPTTPPTTWDVSIQINDTEYSLHCRGLNLVVYNYASGRVIDSVIYDQWLVNPTFYHKNFLFSDEYFDSHFFVPEKYKEAVWRKPFRNRYYSNREVSAFEAENGVFLPMRKMNGRLYGGACDKDFNFIAGHTYFSEKSYKSERCILESYKPKESEVVYVDEEVVFGGFPACHPGHLIVEYVAEFLWWVAEHPEKNIKIAIQRFGGRPLSFLLEYLELLNISPERVIEIEKPTRFKKLIIPQVSHTCYYAASNPYEFTDKYKNFFAAVEKDVPEADVKKIFLVKSEDIRLMNNLIGQDLFVDYYKSKGFTIIDPVDYTLREKIAFMKGADEVATVSSTSFLYCIFCKPTVKITVLSRVSNGSYLTNEVCLFSEIKGFKEIYSVDVSRNLFDKDFTLSLHLLLVTEQFRQYVKVYFNDDLNLEDYAERNKDTIIGYLRLLPKYYSKHQGLYDAIKNIKMSAVLQNLSELFYNEDFNTEKLDLTTNEDKLKEQVKQLTLERDALKKRNTDLEAQINSQNGGGMPMYKIAADALLITPDKPNVPTKAHIDFPVGLFTKTPSVFANPKTAVPGIKELGISVTNITKTGCDIYLTRTDAVETGVCWAAIQV